MWNNLVCLANETSLDFKLHWQYANFTFAQQKLNLNYKKPTVTKAVGFIIELVVVKYAFNK